MKNSLLIPIFLTITSLGLFSTATSLRQINLVEGFKDRLPNGFVEAVEKAKGSSIEIINTRQIVIITPSWDPKLAMSKRTEKNADWTYVKMSDNTFFVLDEEIGSFLNRVRNQQQ